MIEPSERRLTTARWAVGVAFGLAAPAAIALWVAWAWQDFDLAMGNIASTLPMVAFGVVGLVILRQRPSHIVGWSFALLGLQIALAGLGAGLQTWGLAPAIGEALGATPVFSGLIALGLLTFPTGRIPSPRWRWLLWLIVASFVVDIVLAIAGIEPQTVVLAVVLLPALASLFFRRRSAAPVERQQLRWLFWATLLFVLEVMLGTTLEALGQLDSTGQYDWIGDFIFMGLAAGIPVAMGVAITRYRLFDLDRLVSRTLSYTVVVGVLAAAYAGLVLALRSFLPVEGPLPVALSTLAVAFAFLPLARRVQAFVDRRFFRSRYDGAAVVASFADELRTTVDSDSLVDRTEAVVEETFQAESVDVWLAEGVR